MIRRVAKERERSKRKTPDVNNTLALSEIGRKMEENWKEKGRIGGDVAARRAKNRRGKTRRPRGKVRVQVEMLRRGKGEMSMTNRVGSSGERPGQGAKEKRKGEVPGSNSKSSRDIRGEERWG